MFEAEPGKWIAVAAVLTVVVAGVWTVPALLRWAARTSDLAAPDFAALGRPGFRTAVALTTVFAAVPVVGWTSPSVWCVWLGMIALGPLLGWIDAATMWLPLRLTHLLWWLTGIGLAAGVALAAVTKDPLWWQLPLGAVLGAATVGGFFALVWWLGRGALGFGDVRLAVAIGAVTGAAGFTVAFAAVVIGTLTAAGWAVARSVRGRREPFPYGPFLLVGAFLAPLFG